MPCFLPADTLHVTPLQLPQGHRVLILASMESVLRETLADIDEPLAADIIKQAALELTQSKVRSLTTPSLTL